jgi:hypothetical protein
VRRQNIRLAVRYTMGEPCERVAGGWSAIRAQMAARIRVIVAGRRGACRS